MMVSSDDSDPAQIHMEVYIMSDNRFTPCGNTGNGCGKGGEVRTVCVETNRILDSCRDRDCYENVKVFLTDLGQEVIEHTTQVRVKDACIAWTYIGIDPVQFNRGFYTIHIRFYVKLIFEACVCAGHSREFDGIAAEQHHLLFQHGNAVELGGLRPRRTAYADAGLEDELDVEADVNGVEAAVELDGVNADVSPGDAGVLDADLSGVLDDLLTQIGEKDTDVLIAVPIAAGIQNAVGLHANGPHVTALATAVPRSRAGNETIFRHDSYLLKDWGWENSVPQSQYMRPSAF